MNDDTFIISADSLDSSRVLAHSAGHGYYVRLQLGYPGARWRMFLLAHAHVHLQDGRDCAFDCSCSSNMFVLKLWSYARYVQQWACWFPLLSISAVSSESQYLCIGLRVLNVIKINILVFLVEQWSQT
jgi:hypothetical protein